MASHPQNRMNPRRKHLHILKKRKEIELLNLDIRKLKQIKIIKKMRSKSIRKVIKMEENFSYFIRIRKFVSIFP